MGFRFRRRITVVRGVHINLSTTGASLSLGPKGTSINIGRRGVRTTQDLPGSGAYWSDEQSWHELGDLLTGKKKSPPGGSAASTTRSPGRHSSPGRQPKQTGAQDSIVTSRVGQAEFGENAAPIYIRPGARLDLNFFQRLSAPDDEEALLAGLKALAAGDQRAAYESFCQAAHTADGAFMAGIGALQFGIYTDAIGHLSNAWKGARELGSTLRKYGVDAWVSFQLTEEIVAHIRPDVFGLLLALAEANQRLGDMGSAKACLRQLLKLAPGDILARLALAEILSDEETDEADVQQELASLGAGVENDSELHCALLLYQARALMRLKLYEGAKAALTKALSKRKDRDSELLLALRYERAEAHEALGDRASAKADLERIYAEDPDFEDVAQRLGKSPGPRPTGL